MPKISLVALLSAGVIVFTSALALTPAAAAGNNPEYDAVRGGLLFDRWMKVTEGYEIPRDTHPAYKGERSGRTTWECWTCHGWDYKGENGAPALQPAAAKPIEELAQAMTSPSHGYGEAMMSQRDFANLAKFVKLGVIDTTPYIDAGTGKAKGDTAKGKAYFDTQCARCHGLDGKKDFPMGRMANENPWRLLHKIRFGEPLKDMPAMMVFDPQIAADILTYTQTLPE